MVLYSNAWRKCDATDKRGEETEEHECPKNYEGSSKKIEAGEILNIVEYEFFHCSFIIDVIVRYDASTTRTVLNHLSICDQGQVLKSSKGKLDKEDHPHNVKVVAKHIFYVVKGGKDQRYECTKADDLRLNKYWWYMINKNRNKSL